MGEWLSTFGLPHANTELQLTKAGLTQLEPIDYVLARLGEQAAEETKHGAHHNSPQKVQGYSHLLAE